jgi:hypothetical protein
MKNKSKDELRQGGRRQESDLRQEMERKQIDAFIKAYDEATKAIAEKHGYQMVPYLDSSNPFVGAVPRLYPHKVTIMSNEKTDTPTD